ncbi:hypothetical protein [Streptomyces sp. SAI-127]|uniref:hypothetical protein n=1 Tax=Streptomyces sp. SAI-127 TaxID=2940543 RepID=UPI002475C98D|nr:hypothetical protein [Streptomyces sp. SAI-127]MDH6489669.1 hypothetical protein [Streptomyces sp. SAI-127]
MAVQTFYYEHPDGSLTERTTTAAEPVHPEGVTLLTEADYTTKLAAAEAALEQQHADTRAAETAAKESAYEALLAVGIPEASARQISGYWTAA